MAIDKGIETEYGAVFNYHKLREVRIINDDKVGVQVVLTVQSWINKAARISGKEACVRKCIINDADFAMTPFYALLKAKFPEFTSGNNDFDNSFKGEAETRPEFIEQTVHGEMINKWHEGDAK